MNGWTVEGTPAPDAAVHAPHFTPQLPLPVADHFLRRLLAEVFGVTNCQAAGKKEWKKMKKTTHFGYTWWRVRRHKLGENWVLLCFLRVSLSKEVDAQRHGNQFFGHTRWPLCDRDAAKRAHNKCCLFVWQNMAMSETVVQKICMPKPLNYA